MILLAVTTLLPVLLAAPMQQGLSVNDDGSYSFYYETGKEGGSHSRSEIRHPDGVVEGKFSYEDPNGELREVTYRADDSGYVANGDVGVEGAPKGQFPAPVQEVPEELAEEKTKTPEPHAEESKAEEVSAPKEEPEPKQDDEVKDLPLEDSPVDVPPEGFPEGFFLQHFQGLRRLPEPTKQEAAPTKGTTSRPTLVSDEVESPKKEDTDEIRPVDQAAAESTSGKLAGEMELFMHLRPFQGFAASHQVDSSMFHQPVYIFSYQHPDSYGYHYYY